MNSKHGKTLALVFKDPVSGTIEWTAVDGLLIAVGCEWIEGSGSRVGFMKDGEVETFHRPHPIAVSVNPPPKRFTRPKRKSP